MDSNKFQTQFQNQPHLQNQGQAQGQFQGQAQGQAQGQHQGGPSLDEFIFRKLQPVKVLVALLQRELELNEQEQISLDRGNLENLLTTLELFVEDYERVSQVKSKRQQQQQQQQQQPPVRPLQVPMIDASRQRQFTGQVKAA